MNDDFLKLKPEKQNFSWFYIRDKILQMEDISYLLLALTIALLVWVMWYVASKPTFGSEKLVTNNPQLISTYQDGWFREGDTSYADYIKLPFMYF
jgi:hypothetical protein